MNIRKSIDYSMMYAAIDVLMQSKLEQTKLFCEIGKVIDERPEKGAAVAAAEYINAAFPDRSGFSPRSLRRMRDFYRAYKNDPDLMEEAMGVSWSLNALIIENCEDHDTRKWYVKACLHYGWSKQELSAKIADSAHKNTVLDTETQVWYTEPNSHSIAAREPCEEAADPVRAHLTNTYVSRRVFHSVGRVKQIQRLLWQRLKLMEVGITCCCWLPGQCYIPMLRRCLPADVARC